MVSFATSIDALFMTNSTLVSNRYRLRFSGLWLGLIVTLLAGLPGWAQLTCPQVQVNAVPSVVVCGGATTSPIVFSGTGTLYRWTNSNPAIGLADQGTTIIPSFTALNFTGAPLIATITVTALGSNNCQGQSRVFTIRVNPRAQLNQPVSQTVCVGSTTAPVNFTGTNNRATTYRWTNSNPGIGLPASGTGDLGSFTALNTTASVQTATITVTPEQPAFVYVANNESNNVSVINTATSQVVATIPVGMSPYGVSVSGDGSRVYVANFNSNTVSVINTATNEVINTIRVGLLPVGVSVSRDGSRVYVANRGSNSVSVINAATNEVIATIGVGSAPIGISVSGDGSRIYVANANSNNVSVINTATNQVIATIPVGSGPFSLGNFVGPAGCTGAAKTFTITVNPAPTDIRLNQSAVAENQAAGTAVGTFSTTDGGAGGAFSYSLVSSASYPDNNAFTLGAGASAGQLLTRAVLDYETKASYNIRVAITNACSLSYEQSFTITVTDVDDTPPPAPSTPDLTAGSDSGVSATDNITNVVSPTFSGTAEPGTTVRLVDTDGLTVLGSTTATSGGNWSITSASLSPGTHTVSAKATNAAGNVSAASPGLLIIIDTTPPTVTITSAAANPTSTSPIPLTATFSESVTGVSLPAVSNGTASNLVAQSGTAYTFSVTPTATRTVTVSILANAAQDVAGNGNTVATPFIIQYNAPPQPPLITTQPVAGSSVCAGSSVTASVVVSGVATVSYQWYKNNLSTPLANQTSATLLLSGVQTADAGSYSVVVSSAGGSVTSTAFSLSVNALPTASLSSNGPLSCTLTSVTLSASGGGTGETLSYQFSAGATRLNGSNTASVSSPGVYSVTVVNSSGCSATASTTVGSDQTAPTASITASTTLLTDATPLAILTGSGGASGQPAAFNWSTGQTTAVISVSVAGTYSLTVTSPNGCSATASVAISCQTPVASFSCASGVAYQVAGTSTSNSTLYRYDVNTGSRTTIAALPVKANAIGFDVDNRLWGYDINNQRVIQIGPTGQVNAFAIAHLPASGFNVGELLPGGYLVLYVSNATRYYVVDVNPAHGTYLQLVDPTNKYALQTGPDYGSPLSSALAINDFAYNGATNRFVALTNPSSSSTGFKLVVINPATGSVSYGPTVTGADIRSETGGYGGQFIGATGSLCVFANELGKFYQIDLISGAATVLSNSTPAGNNDGASCPTAVLSYLVSGTVYKDANGLADNQLNGTGTNISGALRAILYDNTTGQVGAITPVNADGTFSLGATPAHAYTLYLSSLSATVGQSAVPTLGLPSSWTFVGEHLGSGPGSDGTPDGILAIGLVNDPVTSANFGLQPLPDLTLLLYARPSTVYGTKPIALVVDVMEVGGVDSRGLITVRLSKDSGFSLGFDPTTSLVNNRPVQNSEWSVDATSDENYYLLTSRRVIAAGETLSIGLVGSLRAGATSGIVTVSGVLVGGSGGETKVTNNTDAEKIDYFQQ